MAKNTSIGIDIGNSQIKVVLLKKSGNGVKIERFFVENYGLSPKELSSPITVVNKRMEIISKIFKELKPVNVVVAVAKGEDNIRTIQMPLMTEQSLRQALRWGGQPDYIPFDLKEMTWDVVISQVYRRKEEIRAEGKEKMDVIIALAKKNIVNSYLDIFESSNALIDILDSNTLSGSNFTCFNYAIPKDKIWAKIDFGAEMTTVNVLEGSNLKFTLNIPWGVNDITELAQAVIGITGWKEAQETVHAMDFNAPENQVMQALEPKIKDFIRQLNGAISFYESKNQGSVVSEVMLSGGGAMLCGMDKFIGSKINKEVKIENEINRSLINYDKKDEVQLKMLLPQLNVAIGAAMRNLVELRNTANLLPFDIMLGRKLKSRRTSTVVILAAALALLFTGVGLKFSAFTKDSMKLVEINAEFDAHKGTAGDLLNMKDAVDTFETINDNYATLNKNSTRWSEALIELSALVPKNTFIANANWSARSQQFLLKTDKKFQQEQQEIVEKFGGSKNFSGMKLGRTNETDSTYDYDISRVVVKGRSAIVNNTQGGGGQSGNTFGGQSNAQGGAR